jgi:hypothetical protein
VTTYLSAAEVRHGLSCAIEQFTAAAGVGPRLAVNVPPTVRFAAEVLAVDLPALVEQLAVEHGWPSWSIRYT